MLAVVWTDEALLDVQRLILFQLAHNGAEAVQDTAMGLFNFADGLPFNPRIWRQLKQFDGDVRRGLWSRYEIRYEIDDDTDELRVLRVFAQRENRST
ncbi:MAG: type II toxin-antitoxin system RelE/ParE family toxin [Candidimonas sp.]|nr:MAG: type II toxin-antitoxin system RelE/ParE family toxin [Candidimonas sp.]TAM25512.1 MAG: type II toxin-antitoxin system RelE/ParE family toxin [Candidimonas sp.]